MRKITIIMLFASCCFLFISCVGPTKEKTDDVVANDIPNMQDSTRNDPTIKKNETSKIKDEDDKTKKAEVDKRNHPGGLIGFFMFFWEGFYATSHFIKTHKPSWW